MRVMRRLLPRTTQMPASVPLDYDRRVRQRALTAVSRKVRRHPDIKGKAAVAIQEIIADEYRK